jgi:hypothetical protein
MIVGSLADGLTVDQIVAEYPQLSPEDVLGALAYAAEVLHQESLLPLSAWAGEGGVRFKIDEDLPHAVAALLREAGYEDVASVRDQGMGGWKDPILWQAVQEEGRFLIMADKGFADLSISSRMSCAVSMDRFW